MPVHAGKTRDAVKARGQLVCGVNTGLASFSQADTGGTWSGLDVDFAARLPQLCSAMATK